MNKLTKLSLRTPLKSFTRSKHLASFTINEIQPNLSPVSASTTTNFKPSILFNGLLFFAGVAAPSLYLFLNNERVSTIRHPIIEDHPELRKVPTSSLTATLKSYFPSHGGLHLTKETLRGTDMIEAEYRAPLMKVIKLGDKVCGHRGIVHGGLLATLLEEATREFAGLDSSARGQFSINYRAPVPSNRMYTIVGQPPRRTDSGLKLEAAFLDESGRVLTDITATFPESRNYSHSPRL